MNPKSLQTLEFPKILERLAGYTNFSASRELALALTPTSDLREAQERLAQTAEARALFAMRGTLTIGGARDVRPLLPRARRGESLLPQELLDIRATLQAGRTLRATFSRLGSQFPRLAEIAARIEPCNHLVAEIGRCLNERGEVLDSASEALARIRRELREAHDRLMSTLERLVTNTANMPYLQEPIVTQRGGRYVIPLKAECKGRIPGLVHDQSASGATLFIEPLATVELNNAWRERQLEEEREIRRILAELTDLVADEALYIERTVEALAELDLAFAKARYAEAIRAVEPELVAFQVPKGKREAIADEASGDSLSYHPGSTIDLRRARHPLLNPETVVPIDVHLGDDYFILVITGPNTGGKTVSLKTVGLLACMAQAGLAIPVAEGSRLSVFAGIYADIGDEQSIEQSLSTFSSHMRNIIGILSEADEHSLVLLDELGAGTDPEEGSALARALLSHLRARRITTLATTHYSELKVYAHATPGIRNASVEFDLETLSPTYELTIGLPGRSNALAIARRLGLDPAIIAAAQALVNPESLQAESLLAEIKAAREAALAARAEAEQARHDVEVLRRELAIRLVNIEEERLAVLNAARTQAQEELAAARAEITRVRARLSALDQRDQARELAEAQAALARQAEALPVLEPPPPPPAPEPTGPLQVGDLVWVPSLQASGEITALDGDEAEIQMGALRLRLLQDRLELRQRPGPAVAARDAGPCEMPSAPSPGMELDLRGWRAEEVPPRLDKYLDAAFRAGLPWVRIIHGKGTGVLRQVVSQRLTGHPLVKRQRLGDPQEGGDGVTIAELASQ
jgi:DNA mismatch repair protein MutS2